jgi:hypothetical protein
MGVHRKAKNIVDRKYLSEIEKEGLHSKNYRPKDVKFLMAKIRKELKSIETTGIRKAMKQIPAKAHRLGATFFCK